MSIRITLLALAAAALAIYAWRDWFISLCGLVVMMAVMQHPDMPKSIMEIQGLNPWNIVMASILLAWFVHRPAEGLVWDMPRSINIMLVLYLAVVLVGFVRMMADRELMTQATTGYLIGEYLINTLKWAVPGLLFFDGMRTPARRRVAMVSILALYVLLAVQVIRWMPPGAAFSGEALTARSRKIILNEVGYHPINMSMMLAGAFWALVAALPLMTSRRQRAGLVLAAILVVYGQALTAGRAGYAAWGVVGLILCLVRWRKYLLWAPLVPIVVAVALPGSTERMLEGFGSTSATGDTFTDDYEVTSGRTLIWPYVIEKIEESPVVGYGRQAMVRTGLSDQLWTELGESFPHPHNAYFEALLDNGIVGFAMIMPFYGVVLVQALRLFRDRHDPWTSAIGGLTAALVLALLAASVGSQTFYPREGAVGMWAAIGLMFRTAVERRRQAHAFSSMGGFVWTGNLIAGRPGLRPVTQHG